MDTKVAAVAANPNLVQTPVQTDARPAESGKAKAAAGPEPVETRLVIEEDQASGSFVYKTINRLTGEVVQQLPREEVLKLRDELHYAAGKVIQTKA